MRGDAGSSVNKVLSSFKIANLDIFIDVKINCKNRFCIYFKGCDLQ